MSHGYAITNALSALAAGSFIWSSAYTTSRTRLNDGKQDELAASAAAAAASGQTLVIDLGSATAIAAIALLNHNLASGACAVRVRAADDAAITVNVVTAKAATTINTARSYDKDAVLQFPSVAKRYWELAFTHSGTKIVTLGELLFFASITTLSRTIIYGHGETKRYVKNQNASDTGAIRSTLLSGPIRSKSLPFSMAQGATERDELMAMFDATYGGVLNMLWVDFVESSADAGSATSQQCLWGKLAEEFAWTEGDFTLYDVRGLQLQGLGREVGA